jgi:hypothetical protein
LTPDAASDLCEFLADCHEEFPAFCNNVRHFLPERLASDVFRGFYGTERSGARDPLAYDVGVWCRENLGNG